MAVPLAKPDPADPCAFTAEEIALINGKFLVVRAVVMELGGEVPARWDEAWAALTNAAPDGTLAQCFMVNSLRQGLTGLPFPMSNLPGSEIAFRIGRTIAGNFPNPLETPFGEACLTIRDLHQAVLQRIEDQDV
jgi:hypothetical protein